MTSFNAIQTIFPVGQPKWRVASYQTNQTDHVSGCPTKKSAL